MNLDHVATHPEPERLWAFLRAELSPREGKPIIAHLLRGCAHCAELLAPMVRSVFHPLREQPTFDLSAYDPPIDRAVAAARREIAERSREIELAEQARLASPLAAGRERCTTLLVESWALRTSDPAGMVTLARLAAQLADSLGPEDGAAAERADFQARAWSELGNALRIAADVPGSETAFAEALLRAERGTGDRQLFARIFDLTASLRISQRRFREACRLLEGIFELHRAAGEHHLAGRALIKRGIALLYENEFEEACRYIAHGLGQIDPSREPALALSAVHNLVIGAVEAGAYEQAARWIGASRTLYDQRGSAIDQLKLRWLEGRIEAGRGDLESAELGLWEVHDEFESRGLPIEAAVVSLDLAMLWLQQGRTAEILESVEEILETFRALGIRREAVAALLVLRRAIDHERATNELARLLRRVSGRLKRQENLTI